MTVLHELLAVEQGLTTTAARVTNETSRTLGTKRSIFTGLTKKHEVFAEEDQHLVQATEYKEVQATVQDNLDYLGEELARLWDCSLQKEEANQRAKADIVVDGVVLAKDVPSIILLNMEKKLSNLLEVYNVIPTLDAAVAWEVAAAQRPGIYQTKHSSERFQTVSTERWVEISPATREHKAQLVKQEEKKNIGKYVQTDFSGMISSVDKAGKIQRLTKLIREVKKARQRANNTEVKTDLTFGMDLLNYVNNG